jgi:hypothetical protein
MTQTQLSSVLRWTLAPGLLLLVGCGGGESLNRQAVKGTVTVNGSPLANGQILFTPKKGTSGPAAAAAVSVGMYRIEELDGLVPGDYRVEIQSTPDLGFAIDDDVAFTAAAIAKGRQPIVNVTLPAQFNSASTLDAVVTEGDDANEFHFPLTVADAKATVRGQSR